MLSEQERSGDDRRALPGTFLLRTISNSMQKETGRHRVISGA